MIQTELFVFGLIIGSFLNVLAVRYDPDHFLFAHGVIGGRSHCPHCKKQLRWFELIPLFSYLVQGGRCRSCRTSLSLQYPVVEIACGLVLAFVPAHFANPLLPSAIGHWLSVLWVLVFFALFLMSLIDIRHYIIPDELNIGLAVLGVAIAFITPADLATGGGSFMGPYSMLFGTLQSQLANRAVAVGAACLLFGGLIIVTRGRGMGMGDWKLAMGLAIIFGWPDCILVFALAFIIGALSSVVFVLDRKKTLKSFLPFGPFLASAAVIVFFFGKDIVHWYFSLFTL